MKFVADQRIWDGRAFNDRDDVEKVGGVVSSQAFCQIASDVSQYRTMICLSRSVEFDVTHLSDNSPHIFILRTVLLE